MNCPFTNFFVFIPRYKQKMCFVLKAKRVCVCVFLCEGVRKQYLIPAPPDVAYRNRKMLAFGVLLSYSKCYIGEGRRRYLIILEKIVNFNSL